MLNSQESDQVWSWPGYVVRTVLALLQGLQSAVNVVALPYALIGCQTFKDCFRDPRSLFVLCFALCALYLQPFFTNIFCRHSQTFKFYLPLLCEDVGVTKTIHYDNLHLIVFRFTKPPQDEIKLHKSILRRSLSHDKSVFQLWSLHVMNLSKQ